MSKKNKTKFWSTNSLLHFKFELLPESVMFSNSGITESVGQKLSEQALISKAQNN